MSFAVVGTGTEVGKTVTSAVLLQRYGRQRPVGYWKPLASGLDEGSDTETVCRLAGMSVQTLPELYQFKPPLSPHLAARLAEVAIEPEKIVAAFHRHESAQAGRLVIEGIGGVMVPCRDDGWLFVDLLQALSLPCLVVSTSALGTINHSLLTLEALRSRDLEVLGVVVNGRRNSENRKAIRDFGQVEILGEIDEMSEVSPASVADAALRIDPSGRLEKYLEG